jgi:tellurite resistance protein
MPAAIVCFFPALALVLALAPPAEAGLADLWAQGPAPLARAVIVDHTGPVLVGLGGLVALLAWRIRTGRKRRQRKVSDALALNALAAMTHVAISDGNMDDRAISRIAAILARLTGRAYAPSRVRDMIEQVQAHIADVDALGAGLTEAESRIVLESALRLAVADGQIRPGAYRRVSQIAHRLRIGGADFRDALETVSKTLNEDARAV